MKRYKRFLVILLLLAMVIPVFYYPEIAFADDNRIRIEKLNGKQYLVFNVSATQSTARYRYRTKGWNIKAKFDNGYSKNFYFDSFEFTETATGNQVSMLLEEVLTAGGISRETLAYGGSLEVGARQVILVDGRETSPVYNEQGDIIYAIKARYGIEWSQQTQSDLMTYHGLKLYFDPPIPDPDPEPEAKFDIIHNGLVKTNNTTPVIVESLPTVNLQDHSTISIGSIVKWDWSVWEDGDWVSFSSIKTPSYKVKENTTHFKLEITSDKGKIDTISHSINFAIGSVDEALITVEVRPDPKEKKFENKDVEVELTIKGDLNNYSNKDNISRWLFYAKHKGEPDSKYQTKIVYNNNLSESGKIRFTIPASKVTGDEFIQEYDIKAKVEFKKQVDGSYSLEGKKKTSVFLYRNEPETIENPPNLQPPIAIIKSPSQVMAGEEIVISGGDSFHPLQSEGNKIVEWLFGIPGANGAQRGQYYDAWYPIENVGLNRVELVVTDNHGLRDKDETRILVTEPIPEAILKFKGTLKENRKIILDGSNSYSPKHYPLKENLTVYKITDLDGKTNDIYYNGNLKGSLVKEILIKKPGTYKVELYIENTLGNSDIVTEIIEVVEDRPPSAGFSVSNTIFRNKDDSNYATIRVDDISLSLDDDFIDDLTFKIYYNSTNAKDNEGSPKFDKTKFFSFRKNDFTVLEEKVMFYEGFSYKVKRISLDTFEIRVTEVGYYLIELEAKERFGQETMLNFINEMDYKKSNTENKVFADKVVKVDNHPPVGNFKP